MCASRPPTSRRTSTPTANKRSMPSSSSASAATASSLAKRTPSKRAASTASTPTSTTATKSSSSLLSSPSPSPTAPVVNEWPRIVLTALERLNDAQSTEAGVHELTDFLARLNLAMRRQLAAADAGTATPKAAKELALMMANFRVLLRSLLATTLDNSTLGARRKVVRLLAVAIDEQPALSRDFLLPALKFLVQRYGREPSPTITATHSLIPSLTHSSSSMSEPDDEDAHSAAGSLASIIRSSSLSRFERDYDELFSRSTSSSSTGGRTHAAGASSMERECILLAIAITRALPDLGCSSDASPSAAPASPDASAASPAATTKSSSITLTKILKPFVALMLSRVCYYMPDDAPHDVACVS